MSPTETAYGSPYSYQAPTATVAAPQLTDANLNIVNDYQHPIQISFSNETAVNLNFPTSQPIAPTHIQGGYVAAKTLDPAQSRFTVHFTTGETMVVDIGQSPYKTDVNPPVLNSGQGGAILAPGEPISNAPDYDFYFFNGPGLCQPLFNGLFQAQLPIILESVAKEPLSLYTNAEKSVKVELTGLKLPDGPASIGCVYASCFQVIGDSSLAILNSLFRLANVQAVLNITFGGHTYTLDASVQNMMIYLSMMGDLTLHQQPKVGLLRFSLEGYSLGGSLIEALKIIAPPLYSLLTDGVMDAYRLAGLLNTKYNSKIVDAINGAIETEWKKLPTDITPLAMVPTIPPGSNGNPDNGLASWMSKPAIQALTLGALKLPGTHDSPTRDLTINLSPIMNDQLQVLKRLSPGPNPPANVKDPIYVGQPLYDFIFSQVIFSAARAQDTSIANQLQNGIRYLDMRLYWDPVANDFNYQHTLAGQGFRSVLQEINFFLQRLGTNELVFMLISNTNFGEYIEQTPVFTNFTTLIGDEIALDNIYCPSSDANFDLNTLAGTKLGDIVGTSSKIMFMFADNVPGHTFTDTVTNCQGFPQNDWGPRMDAVEKLVARESPTINNHPNGTPLWGLRWSLDSILSLMPLFVVNRLSGVQNWLLEYGAQLANQALPGFLAQHGGSSAQFNLLTCDEFEAGIDVAKFVIDMNTKTAADAAASLPN